MMRNLFRKKDSSYTSSNSLNGYDPSPLSSSYYAKSSSLNESFSSTSLLTPQNNSMSGIPSKGSIVDYSSNDDEKVDNMKNMNIQDNEQLSDQSNMHMPALYGLNTSSPLPSFKLSDKLSCFRMLIIQDAGIRTKQPLFDSAVPYNKNFSIMQQKLNKHIHHSINELSLFMFGCYGMPLSETNMTTKVHHLPSLSNLHSSILITRLFSLDSSFKLKPHKLSSTISDWETHPILEADELPMYENASTRFAVGLVIPVSSSIESVRDEVTENWSEISDSLLTMQNLIVAKLKQQYNIQNKMKKLQIQNIQSNNNDNNNNGIQNQTQNNISFQTNKQIKFCFPIYSLQSEVEIYQKLTLFLSLLVSLLEVPRLFIDLKHSNQSLIDWASTLSLWLELKDGRQHLHDHLDLSQPNNTESFSNISYNNLNSSNHPVKFLASLLSIFLPLRHELFSNSLTTDEKTSKLRIIIGTGNPAVSQKLIFILAGLLGYEEFSDLYDKSLQLLRNSDIMDTKKKTEANKSNSNPIPVPVPMPVPIPIARFENMTPLRNVQARNNSLIYDTSSAGVDLVYKSSPSLMSHSPSVSTISASIQTQRIPVPTLTRTSSYASLQNLSTSYGTATASSSGTQALSNSWRQNFGSFMERWKNSVTPSPTTSQFSQSPNTETPSPNIEYEEYPWFMNKKSNPLLSPDSSLISVHTTSTQQTQNKFSTGKAQNIGHYTCIDDYDITRSTCNLISPNFSNMADNISFEINSIMNGEFSCNMEDSLSDSVMNISVCDKNKEDTVITCTTALQLPLLVGYVPQYRPEFNMMSCPNKNLQNSIFIETMKDDLKYSNIEKSHVYFINLGMRRVNFLEMKNSTKKPESNTNGDTRKPKYSNKASALNSNSMIDSDVMRNIRSKSKSNLTKTMESDFEVNQSIIFTPTKPFDEEQHIQELSGLNGLNIYKNNRNANNVDKYDHILEEIAFTINRFFFDIRNGSESDEKSEKENKCCEAIRQLITDLLDTSDS